MVIRERFLMDERRKSMIGRREMLRAATTMGVAAATIAVPHTQAAAAETISNRGKRQSRYQPNSAEVQTYYRVNSYPAK